MVSNYSGVDVGNYTITDQVSTTASVTPKVVVLNAPTGNRVYDGHIEYVASAADLAALSAALGVSGDSVTSIALVYDDKNVGTGKTLTASNALLSDGNGGNNYSVSYAANTDSTITRLNSVTWVGGDTGNWFDPNNWAGGAVPDLSNVANVVIPDGVTVSFNTTGSGLADATQPVHVDSIGTAGGSLNQSEGTLNVGTGGIILAGLNQSGGTLTNAGSTTLDDFNQSGGTFTSDGPMSTTNLNQTGGSLLANDGLTVTESFSQGSSGSIAVIGDATITDISGGTQLGNLSSTGNLVVNSTDGPITQAPDTAITVSGSSSLSATQGGNAADITLDSSDNTFDGLVNVSGKNVTILATKPVTPGVLNVRGKVNIYGVMTSTGSVVQTTFNPSSMTGVPPVSMNAASTQASPLAFSSGAGSTSAMLEPSKVGGGLVVVLNQEATQLAAGSVTVSIPASMLSTSFSFALPEEVVSADSNSAEITVSLLGNLPLPSWLRYDATQKLFFVSAIPDDALPLKLTVLVGNLQTVVELVKGGE